MCVCARVWEARRRLVFNKLGPAGPAEIQRYVEELGWMGDNAHLHTACRDKERNASHTVIFLANSYHIKIFILILVFTSTKMNQTQILLHMN